MRRGAGALPPSAPRTAPSPPPAGARHRRPNTEGALTSLAFPPQTPLTRRLGRVHPAASPARLHHEGHKIGGHGRDHPRCGGGDSAKPVCSGQRKSRVVPESAAVLLGPARSAPTAPDQTAPKTPCPAPQP